MSADESLFPKRAFYAIDGQQFLGHVELIGEVTRIPPDVVRDQHGAMWVKTMTSSGAVGYRRVPCRDVHFVARAE